MVITQRKRLKEVDAPKGAHHAGVISCHDSLLMKSACADEEVEAAKGALVGPIMQPPPMYSAVSIKGERLYKAARRGEPCPGCSSHYPCAHCALSVRCLQSSSCLPDKHSCAQGT